MPNVFEPDWDREQDRPPFSWRRAYVGRQAGARQLGASVYDLQPGCATFPLHVHHGNEEMIVVLSGRPTLRTLDEERELEPGAVVATPVAGAGHRIDNLGDEPARVLIVSTMVDPEVVELPESGKVRVFGSNPDELDLSLRRDDAVDYFEGETS